MTSHIVQTHSTEPKRPIRDTAFLEMKAMVSEAANEVITFLMMFPKITREKQHLEAEHLVMSLDEIEKDIVKRGISTSIFSPRKANHETNTRRRYCQALILYSSAWRLRITIGRQFLLDDLAVMEYRFGALSHATQVLSLLQPISEATSWEDVCFNSTWCSGHVYYAISTFALFYITDEAHSFDKKKFSTYLLWFEEHIEQMLVTLSKFDSDDKQAHLCHSFLKNLSQKTLGHQKGGHEAQYAQDKMIDRSKKPQNSIPDPSSPNFQRHASSLGSNLFHFPTQGEIEGITGRENLYNPSTTPLADMNESQRSQFIDTLILNLEVEDSGYIQSAH